MLTVSPESKVAYLTGGGMGTMLAKKAAENGYNPMLWFHSPESFEFFTSRHQSPRLKGVHLPPNIRGTLDIEEALYGASLVCFVTPSRFLDETARLAQPYIKSATPTFSAIKGFVYLADRDEYVTPSQDIREAVPQLTDADVGVMAGPNFVKEAARGVPTVTTVASPNPDIAKKVKEVHATSNFYVKENPNVDMEDVEKISAFKNVVGLLMGYVMSMPRNRRGQNTYGFVFQQGLSEAEILIEGTGGNPDVVKEPCGAGDLALLMDIKRKSRNVNAGYRYGKGEATIEDLKDPKETVEGIFTIEAVMALIEKHHLRMPMTRLMYRVVKGELDVSEAAKRLLELNRISRYR